MSLVVRTLSEQIFTIIRERIISGDLPEEQPIRQDALANELGVSKIPLREALARLEQEGLLTSQANRGFFVLSLGAGEAEEIYELRLALEPDAAARASRVAKPDDQAAAREALSALMSPRGCTARGRPPQSRLPPGAGPSARSGSDLPADRAATGSGRTLCRPASEARRREDRAHEEHHALLEAWLARDEAQVAGFLREHTARR